MWSLMLSASTNFLLNDSNASNGASVSDFVNPRERMNFLIASGLIPLRFNPSKVGNRGSSYQETLPSSISGFRILLETGIPLNSNLENSITLGFLMFKASRIA